jgi:hypothetical protein
VDYEDSIDWSSKFPNTKFHDMSYLQYRDAQTAVLIVLETLGLLSKAFGVFFPVMVTQPKMQAKILCPENINDPKWITKWVEERADV